ncbi:MAG: hypothetical protein A2538_02950 [Candidatus Magasanikbacteria bacterium RIFOXYD2_FULL_41_14]|uniref:Uncharacterized protein n=1 Tax=Candidatus Magasanikbacteria bacterium RIFOXYD2_FULL_41_14 TaxID=1798709 RepID=A0A1F6PCB4_9BACT|nr:MAG: hypothetical protein A2538_02950 [Candidatus Magasanikbacteria bacterium RIFOXYD2_FULL_41_14]
MKTATGIILSALLISIFLSGTAWAVPTVTAPEFNPLCWHKDECENARTGYSNGASGWMAGEPPCDQPGWGKCLPVGETVTTIAFGGQRHFEDIGAFVTTLYNYAVRIAGIVAVIVIIVAGMQWVASGGNSEMIGAAKKRIGGAVIGLMILFSSFVILNTINPNLVKFRLPRIWLIRNSKMMPEFCRQSPSSTDFALLGVNGQTVNLDKFNSIALAPTNFDAMQCGDQYAIKGGGTSICHGDVCNVGSSHQVCAPYIYANMTYGKGYSCVDGQILIRFDMAALMDAINQSRVGADKTEGDEWLDYTDVEVYGVCKNPTTKGLAIGKKSHTWGKGEANVNAQLIDKSSSPWSYAIVYGGFTGPGAPYPNSSNWECPSGFDLDGFILRTEINRNLTTDEPFLYIGQSESGGPVYGSWPTVGVKNYIRKSNLGKSALIMNIALGDGNIKDIFDNEDKVPFGEHTITNPFGYDSGSGSLMDEVIETVSGD